MVTGATDIHMDSSYSRAMDTDMAPGCNPGLDVTMAFGDKQTSHISPFLTTFPSDLPLYTVHELFCGPPPYPATDLLTIRSPMDTARFLTFPGQAAPGGPMGVLHLPGPNGRFITFVM